MWWCTECSIEGDEDGIHILDGPDGRPSGEAYVELAGAQDVELALKKDKCHIGRRYIDGGYIRPLMLQHRRPITMALSVFLSAVLSIVAKWYKIGL